MRDVRKSASEMMDGSRNDQEAVFASVFSTPGIGIVIRGDNFDAVRQRKRAWRSLWTIFVMPKVIQCIHPTVKVLPHHNARCLPERDARPSRARRWKRRAAVSRSFIVMGPNGLESWRKKPRMCWGHSRCHTVGGRSFRKGSQTPPAP